jgi:hypothetical protein
MKKNLSFRNNKSRALVLFFLILSGHSFSATYYWIRTTAGTWNLTTNWSATSGGAGGAGIPTTSDVAIFDGNGNGACSITANVSLGAAGGILMKSTFSGTISMSAGITLTVGSSHFTQYGGTFTGSTGNIIISGRFRKYGGTFTAPTAQLDLQGDSILFSGGTFNHNNGTVRFRAQMASNIYIIGSQNFYNLNFHGTYAPSYYFIDAATSLNTANDLTLTDNGGTGSVVLRTGTIPVQGNIYQNSTNGATGDAIVLINGTANQTIFGMAFNTRSGFPGVTIQKASGTLTLLNYVSVNSNWTYISGTLNTGTSTVTFYRGIYAITITGNHTLYNVTFHSASLTTYTVAAGTTLTVNGTLTYSATIYAIIINTGNISAQGNVVLNNTATGGGGSATITLNGTLAQSLTSNVPALQSVLCNVAINKSAGTLSLAGIITASRDWTYTTGTLNAGASTLVLCGNNSTYIQTLTGSHSLFNLDISPQTSFSSTYLIGSGTTLTVNGTLTLSGTIAYLVNTGTIDAYGDVTVTNASTGSGGGGLIRFMGTANQTLTGSNVINAGRLPRVTIDKTAGTLTIAANVLSVAGNWTYVQGTVNAAGSSIYFYGPCSNVSQSASGSMSFYDVYIGGGTITLGSAMDVNRHFTILLSAFFDVSTSNYTLNIGGNWTNNNSASAISFNQRSGKVIFDGGAVNYSLTLASAAHTEVFYNLEMNRSTGSLALNEVIQVSNNLNFISGNIISGATTYVEILNNATASGAGNSGYVSGPCRKTGTQAFSFPVGKNGFYRAISISAPVNVSDYFTAEYFNSTAPYNIASHDATLQMIDQCEYWTLYQSAGGSNVTVTLSWNSASTPSCTVVVPSDMRVAHWDGAMWRNDGNGGTSGTTSNGTVSGATANSGYGPFTLASSTFANPLPIELILFNATPVDHEVVLDWVTATETNNDYFTIERTADGINFETIITVAGAGTTAHEMHYSAKDENPRDGISYYRLKQTDFNGQVSYSTLRSVIMETAEETFSVYPNPSAGEFRLNMPGDADEPAVLDIYDAGGRIVAHESGTVGLLREQHFNLPAGIYFVKLTKENLVFNDRIVIQQ